MPFPLAIPAPSTDTLKLLVKVGVAAFVYYKAKQLYEDYQKQKGEETINTPEGQIALQLKNIFANTPVDDAAYRRAMQLVTPANETAVRDSYKLQTGRLLSEDEAAHINTHVQETAAKQYKINSTPGSLISIVNDTIKFNVGPGSYIRFQPGQKTPVGMYYTAEDIAKDKPAPVTMPPNSKLWKVSNVKLVDVNGVQLRKDWKAVFAFINPLWLAARTHKQFAAVQIDVSGNGKTFMWINATDMRTWDKPLKGIEEYLVITIKSTNILSEKFEVIKSIPKGVALGKLLMSLQTPKGTFIQIKTIQGLIRWVNKADTLIRKK